ncbi:MAG TPA: hypothetical protein VG757_13500 [Devosia sp.]|nr:hypothetical protein [Devosia sp.]
MSLLRNILIAAALAATSITPSLAMPNTGAFDRSAEGQKATLKQLCSAIGAEAQATEDQGKDGPVLRSESTARAAKQAADDLRQKGRNAGCKF